ncbi:MAG: hypothetical protein ACRCTP_04445 [Aeromonas popoffii]|uniref:hypothetical protein n=1 Tax=Aeromonas popoffii TaxID=70856 RepID=UPI003F3A7AFB
MRLVNNEKAVDITFEAGIEPKALLKMIGDAGHPGTIGLISLRALLEGTGESEINGYMVITDADATEAAELKEAVAEFAAKSEEGSAGKTEGELIEAAQDKEAAAAQDLTAVAGAAETVVEEVAAAGADVGKVDTAEGSGVETVVEEVAADTAAAPVVESEEAAAGTAAEAVKKAFGIDMSKGEGAALTPAPTTSASASRPRRDLGALIEKAMKGAHGALLTAAVAAGYTITNVENTERWFGLSVAGEHPITRLSPRFDVSPLKNGAYSVSLYLNDRATGLKEKLVAAEGAPVTNEAIIASMGGELFKASIAGWKPEAPKAA